MTNHNAALYRRFFAPALRAEIARDAAHEAEVRDWYENGDGRAPEWITEFDDDGNAHQWNAGGRGYRFPTCPHGMSLWTDYDNICGGCEDSLTPVQRAQSVARSNFREYNRRFDFAMDAIRARVPEAARTALLDWVIEVTPN